MYEAWKEVEGYQGMYEVSNTGKVRSYKKGKPKILKNRESRANNKHTKAVHLKVVLYDKHGRTKSISVHQLVARHFIENPKNHKMVMHIDGDTFNNNAHNLKWSNLREINTKDRRNKEKTSKYTGVSRHKGANIWRATAYIGSKQYYLGSYENEENAKRAYDKFIKDMRLTNTEAHKQYDLK